MGKDKSIVIMIMAVAVIIMLLVVINIDRILPSPEIDITGLDIIETGTISISSGNHPDAAVTVIEFSDFLCPYCRQASETMNSVRDYYGDRVNVVFKHFPVYGDTSVRAAVASECAREQGMFWEYHDILFQNSNAVDVSDIKQYAFDMGMDMDNFNDCFDNLRTLENVQIDYSDAQFAGVQGTPTFIIDDQKITGDPGFYRMKSLIDVYLEVEE